MTGGLLQLVARGVDDLFMMGDPEITFFKVVYRRHTNFALRTITLPFNNRMDFGRTGLCRLQRRGDLLHRLILQVTLPEIDLRYKSVTRGEIFRLLLSHGISWETGRTSQSEKLTENDLTEIETLIDTRVTDLEDEITHLDTLLSEVETFHTDNSGLDPADYNRQLIQTLLDQEPDYAEIYRQIAHFGDNYTHHHLVNADELKRFILNQYKDFLFDDPEIADLADKQTFIDNFMFYDKILRSNLLVTSSIIGSVLTDDYFKQIIKDLYINDTDNEYQTLDAYKVFDQYLTANQSQITQDSDIEVLRTAIAENINWGLGKNIQLMMKLYDNFTNDYRFIFYKRLQYDEATDTYNTGEPFLNVSTLTTTIFDDNFTNNMKVIDSLNQPEGITHEYSTYVDAEVTDYHLQNRDYFRDDTFQDYFNDLSLWSPLEIKNYVSITDSSANTKLTKVYLLNLLPVALSSSLQTLMGNVIPNLDSNVYNTARLNTFFTEHIGVIESEDDHLVAFREDIETFLCGEECQIVTAEDLTALTNVSTAYKTLSDDILITGVFKKYPLVDPGDGGAETDFMNYVIRRWHQLITDEVATFNTNYPGDQMTTDDQQVYTDLINTFLTPQGDLPKYEQYQNKYNLFELQVSNEETFIENPLNVTVSSSRYLDVSASIWYHLMQQMIQSYNDFFNNQIFDHTHYETNLGKGALEDLIEIEENQFDLTETDEFGAVTVIQDYAYGDMIDYYYLNTEAITNITSYLETRRASYVRMNTRYLTYEQLLRLSQIRVPRSTYYYETVELTTDWIESQMEAVYDPDSPPSIVADTTALLQNGGTTVKGEALSAQLSVQDFLELLKGEPDLMNEFDVDYANDVRYQQTLGLTAPQLYAQTSSLIQNFNDLAESSDLINFLLNQVVEMSILKTQSFLRETNTDTYEAAVAYFTEQKTLLENQLILIKDGETEVLKDQLPDLQLVGESAQFAWVSRLGNYLIQNLRIRIGGQLVYHATGEWLEHYQSLRQRAQKKRGYDRMIGDVSEWTSYDRTQKKSGHLHIPIPIWFGQDSGNVLPLVALAHSELELEIEMARLDQVAYWETGTAFRKTPRLKAQVLGEYIYLESEERQRIADQRHEQLITQIQMDRGIEICGDLIGDDLIFTHQIHFENLVKYLVWTFQETDCLQGGAGQTPCAWDKFVYTIDGVDYPICDQVKIEFNQRYREEWRGASYYNYVVPYEHHWSTPKDGVGVYSFALEPCCLQPSGVANLSRIDNVTLWFQLNPVVVADMKSTGRRVTLKIYGESYNILRVMSGMAGLAFFSG